MKAMGRASADSKLLEIVFSTPMGTLPKSARIAVRLDNGTIVRSKACQKERATALDCGFAELAATPDATARLLIPRSLASSTGQRVALWAAGPPHIEFER